MLGIKSLQLYICIIINITILFSPCLSRIESSHGKSNEEENPFELEKPEGRSELKRAADNETEIKLETSEEFIQEAFASHNVYRELHGSQPIKLDRQLCSAAEKWAKKNVEDSEEKKKITMSHSHVYGQGENIWMGLRRKGEPDGTRAVDDWYAEIDHFNFTVNFFGYDTGHFTALIWNSTTTVGIGKYEGPNYTAIIAQYKPRGNALYHSSFQNNVFPPRNNTEFTEFDAPTPQHKMVAVMKGRGLAVPPKTSDTDEKFIEEVLAAHNKFRKDHNVPDVVVDKELNKAASEWADFLAKNSENRRAVFAYRDHSAADRNQNVWAALTEPEGKKLPGSHPVEAWYRKGINYDYSNITASSQPTFSQIVWKDTKKIGVAKATNKKGHVYVVVEYSPPGNLAHFGENVLKPNQ